MRLIVQRVGELLSLLKIQYLELSLAHLWGEIGAILGYKNQLHFAPKSANQRLKLWNLFLKIKSRIN